MMKKIQQIISLYRNKEYLSDEGRIIRRTTNYFFVLTIFLGPLHILLYILKEYNQKCDALIFSIPIVAMLLGIVSSLFVSSAFAYFVALLDLRKASDLKRRKKFRDFFDCQTNENLDNSAKGDVAIILPRYRNIKHTDDYDSIKKEIIYKSGKNVSRYSGKVRGYYYRKSIKSYRTSSDNSFSQSDTIAAASIVAAFAKSGMRLPTIRTDLQGISKIFQYDEYDKMRDGNLVTQMISDYFGLEDFDELYPKQELDYVVKGMSNRLYKTYISIGMFSNAFLMDLIINNYDKSDTFCFDCMMHVDEHRQIKRIVKVRSSIGEEPYSTEGLDIDDRDTSTDYALIAKTKFMNRNILVCAGITEAGTQAAALYLAMKWESIVDKMKDMDDKEFAIVLNIDKNQISSRDLINKSPRLDYPRGLFSKLNSF